MEIIKIKLISRNITFELFENGGDDEQHLTLSRDGRFHLSRYCFEPDGTKRICSRNHGRIFQGKEEKIFALLKKYCRDYVPEAVRMDCGSWKMTVSFNDGTEKEYAFSAVSDDSVLHQVSDMIRTELDMFNLYLFDFKTGCPLYDQSSINVFEKYLPLLYENTFLWNRFLELSRSYFYDRREYFFAFHRDRACIATWRGFLDNMGGGVHLYFFQAAAFIILAYKNAGNDIDAELAAVKEKYNDEYV